ncbi:hypothetical protein [Azospirillum canadense]|uniref:hypothetical protein n=1 Tax=Azospirillum canadense TaxID=403962 RepID=UPI0022266A05|nr:hypothetical protein [Azospirillum canadense]MCW2242816.1 hypothetical protein [Azospirillum canadense]
MTKILLDGAVVDLADTDITLPPLPVIIAPVPSTISDRQFFQALAMGDEPYITQAEALAGSCPEAWCLRGPLCSSAG